MNTTGRTESRRVKVVGATLLAFLVGSIGVNVWQWQRSTTQSALEEVEPAALEARAAAVREELAALRRRTAPPPGMTAEALGKQLDESHQPYMPKAEEVFETSFRSLQMPVLNDRQRIPKCRHKDDCEDPDEYDSPTLMFVRDDLLDVITDSHFAAGRFLYVGWLKSEDDDYGQLLKGEEIKVFIRQVTSSGAWEAELRKIDDTAIMPVRPVLREPASPSGVPAPAVTLIEWDENNERPVFGVKCGSRWCWFSLKGRLPSAAERECPDSVTWHTCTEPGWSDVQKLATKESSGLKRKGPRARFIPKKNLAGDFANPTFPGWKLLGVIHVSGRYEKEIKGPTAATTATLRIKKGLSKVYVHRGPHADTLYGLILHEPPANSPPAPNDFQYFKLSRTVHSSEAIPGVLRWEWRPDDEGLWTYCPAGCCKMTTVLGTANPTTTPAPAWNYDDLKG